MAQEDGFPPDPACGSVPSTEGGRYSMILRKIGRKLSLCLIYPVMVSAMLFVLPSSGTAAILRCVNRIDMNGRFADLFSRLRSEGFSPPDRPLCGVVRLEGEITEGDAAALESFIRENLPFPNILELLSNGGSVRESMKIGRVVRRYYLTTLAPISDLSGRVEFLSSSPIEQVPNGACASACFFVWLGGVSRWGDRLGIHRPFPPEAQMRKMTPAEASQLYQSLSAEIRAYLIEMDVDGHWLEDMMKIVPDELHLIPKEKIEKEFQRDLRSFGDIPGIAQWKIAKCGQLSVDEGGDLLRLSRQQFDHVLPRKMPTFAGQGTPVQPRQQFDHVLPRKMPTFAGQGTPVQPRQQFDHVLPRKMIGYLEYLTRRDNEVRTCGVGAIIEARWKLRVSAPNVDDWVKAPAMPGPTTVMPSKKKPDHP